MNKLIKLWILFFFIELITVFFQVYEDVSSAYWLNKQCNLNEEFRKNIKAECIQAAQRMQFGMLHFILNESLSRVRWCFRYSCVDLYYLAFSDFKSLFLLILCSPIVLKQVYKSIYFIKDKFIKRREVKRNTELKKIIEDAD